jgi:hypothetical protein
MDSPYAQAMDATRSAVTRRARHYRNLVMAVALGLLCAVLAAALLRSARPLWALALLPLIVMAFHVADARTLRRWRAPALQHWMRGELRLDLLRHTLRQVPNMPPQTLEGMLETLPADPGTPFSLPARAALAQAQEELARVATRQLCARAVAWLLLCSGAALASWGLPAAGLALAALALLTIALAWLHARGQLARCRASLARALSEAGCDSDGAEACRTLLATSGLPAGLGRRWSTGQA